MPSCPAASTACPTPRWWRTPRRKSGGCSLRAGCRSTRPASGSTRTNGRWRPRAPSRCGDPSSAKASITGGISRRGSGRWRRRYPRMSTAPICRPQVRPGRRDDVADVGIITCRNYCPPAAMAPDSTANAHGELVPLLREAVSLHQAGRLDEALPAYHRFLDENPDNPAALQLLGLLHSQRGEYAAAIEYMRASLTLFPEQPEVANNLGNALSRNGQVEEAISSYAEAVRLQPRYRDAWRNLGLAQSSAGRYDDAEASFRRCLELDPNDAAAWLALGNVHKRCERFGPAIECYEKALALRPDYPEAHHNIGVCKRMQSDPE